MSHHSRVASRRALGAAVSFLLVAVLSTSVSTAQARPAAPTPAATGSAASAFSPGSSAYSSGDYIVVMTGSPAAVYTGGVDGIKATAAGKRGSYDSTSRAAIAYTSYLRSRQTSLAASVGAMAYYHYLTALNGFAARLTASQATSLAKAPGVLAVVKDRARPVSLVPTPRYLGLSGPKGLWRRLGGSNPATGAGRGVTVGVLDTGVDDESGSFAPVGTGVPADWHGVCQHGTDQTFSCNDKLIGGRYFDAGARAAGTIAPEEFSSPDDYFGHGTHVASTAAGEQRSHSSIDGTDFGPVAGMAPAAKVADYKVAWTVPDHSTATALESDAVAGIDAAVADGVDVVNYSIGSGPTPSPVDPVEVAFLFAAQAGVFVAASAGNEGPSPSTVAHASPWLTTVAAATYFVSESTVELGSGARMVGASISPTGVASSPLVYAGDILDPGYTGLPGNGLTAAQEARRCFPGSLDPTRSAGTIVICDRGGNDRVEKGRVVSAAGGVGMIVVNLRAQGVAADVQDVPTVHLEAQFRNRLLSYVHTDAHPTAAILAGVTTGSTAPKPPAIAGFSSRGPSVVAGGDLLKPDISAPGVDVDAATAPEGGSGHGNDFAIMSGTSMASPHIAGLAALIRQQHPRWSPMAVKSAMMTTARDLTDTTNPFDTGAGFVVPRSFLDPGLVYDSHAGDWFAYLAGQGVTDSNGKPVSKTPIRASNLNLASIAVNAFAGTRRVWRTVTNVGRAASTYRASVTGLRGFSATVAPTRLRLAPGQSARFSVTFRRGRAPLGRYRSGTLYWKDRSHVVRSPVVANPTGIAAPSEVRVRAKGGGTVRVRAGFAGTMGRTVGGLVPNVDRAATARATAGAGNPLDARNYRRPVSIAGRQVVLRLQTMPDYRRDDLDLYLLDSTGAVVAASATASAAEQVTVTGLRKGRYSIAVEAFAVHRSRQRTSFTLRSWKVDGTTGTLRVTPRRQHVETAYRYAWRLERSGLRPAKVYLGVVHWTHVRKGPDKQLGDTLVDAG